MLALTGRKTRTSAILEPSNCIPIDSNRRHVIIDREFAMNAQKRRQQKQIHMNLNKPVDSTKGSSSLLAFFWHYIRSKVLLWPIIRVGIASSSWFFSYPRPKERKSF